MIELKIDYFGMKTLCRNIRKSHVKGVTDITTAVYNTKLWIVVVLSHVIMKWEKFGSGHLKETTL